jgi:hypothetical protein
MNYKSLFSARLRVKLQLAYNSEQATNSLPSKENAAAWFRAYLLRTYSIIRSSVPLMQAAYDNCIDLPEEVNLMALLRKYYKKHIREEMHHDEWILDDLESIGVPRRESLVRMPPQAVAELVGSQYYWIYHWHPVCLLGYISFLEGNPPKKELIYRLQKITGHPETAFRTLVEHSDLDGHHRDEFDELLEVLPLTAKHEQWITANALYSVYKLREIWGQLCLDE